jgi:hypothetical protein
MLDNLCYLLSFANGGFVAPIFIEGEKYSLDGKEIPRIQSVSAIVRTDHKVTSLEQLGDSWLRSQSSLIDFVSCFGSFEKMLTQPFWKDTFYFVLIQYFQATPYQDWQVSASATGAALERLSHAILVEDETDLNKKAKYELLYDIRQTQSAKDAWNLGKGTGKENITSQE